MPSELGAAGTAPPRRRDGLRATITTAAALVALALAFAAASGCRRSVRLPFVPALSACVSGAVQEGHGAPDAPLHIRRNARVRLPLLLDGAGTLELQLSSPAGPRRVHVTAGRDDLGTILADGPTPVAHPFPLAHGLRALDLSLTVELLRQSARGVRAHELSLTVESGRLLPSPASATALVLGVLGTMLVLLALGLAWRRALLAAVGLLGLPACLFAALDPFGATSVIARLYAWIPLLTAAAVGALAWIGRRFTPAALPLPQRRWLAVLLTAACLAKGAWLLHPRHFHADARIHNAISRLALERGLVDLWRNIDRYQSENDLGLTRVPGGLTAIRYPPTFYSISHALDRAQALATGHEDVDYWNRLLAVMASVLTLVPVFLIARRWLGTNAGAAVVCAFVDLLAPADFHELAGLSYSALLGKLADLILLCYVLLSGARVRVPILAALLLACLLAYPAAWVTFGTQTALVILALLVQRDWRPALRVAAGAGLAALLAHLLFYGRLALDVLTVHAGAASASATWPSRLAGLLQVRRWFWGEMGVYFTSAHVAAAAWGLARVWRGLADRVQKAWLLSWSLACVGLLAAQLAAAPLLSFYRGAFLFSSLVAIGCGVAGVHLWDRGRTVWRVAAVVLVAALCVAQVVKIVGMIPAFFQAYDAHIPPAWPL